MIVWIVLALMVQLGFGGPLTSHKDQASDEEQDCGEQLFLTPYIDSGDIDTARVLARTTFLGSVETYSGFLTIDNDSNSNMFIWFFPAENNADEAPLTLWLQGGPGAPLINAVFQVNGPFVINDSLQLEKRSSYWSRDINMLYIDNPVGAGFSYTDDSYVSDETEVGRDLYKALIQFFHLFPEYQRNDFFVHGESYAGKFSTAITYTIHKNNPTASQKINLKGLAIGDGLVDLENMMVYGDYLYQHGLIDSTVQAEFKSTEADIVKLIQEESFIEAFQLYDKLLIGKQFEYGTLFYNATGLNSYFNYATSNLDTDQGPSPDEWLEIAENRRSLHVGNQTIGNRDTIVTHLANDGMQSVSPWLEVLMDHYRVILYNGQFDIVGAYPLMLNYLKKLQWSGKHEYENATRVQWNVNGELAGYAKTAGNFTEVLVRDAGHVVPQDQPEWALDLITRFLQNIPYDVEK